MKSESNLFYEGFNILDVESDRLSQFFVLYWKSILVPGDSIIDALWGNVQDLGGFFNRI
jgi:hypothetical protein